MIKWFQNWLRGRIGPAEEPREATLLDVAHEALKRDRVRTKVKKFLSFPLVEEASAEAADEITETVTDTLTEACEADEKLDRLFGDS